MAALPQDVLHLIFSFACRTPSDVLAAALVCRRWNQLAWAAPVYLVLRGSANWSALAKRFLNVAGLAILTSGERSTPIDLASTLVDLDIRQGGSFPLGAFQGLRRLQLPNRTLDLPTDLAELRLTCLSELWMNSASDQATWANEGLLSVSLTGLSISMYSGPPSNLLLLTTLTNLHWLNLSRGFQLSASDLAVITAPLKALRYLDVSGCSKVKKISWLSALPHLEALIASSLPINNADLRAVKSLRKLCVANFQHCSALTNEGFAHLATLPRLQSLDARNTKADTGLRTLFPAHVLLLL